MATPVNPASSAAGRASRAKSPWSKGPHATTGKAKASYIQYRKRGKSTGGSHASE